MRSNGISWVVCFLRIREDIIINQVYLYRRSRILGHLERVVCVCDATFEIWRWVLGRSCCDNVQKHILTCSSSAGSTYLMATFCTTHTIRYPLSGLVYKLSLVISTMLSNRTCFVRDPLFRICLQTKSRQSGICGRSILVCLKFTTWITRLPPPWLSR